MEDIRLIMNHGGWTILAVAVIIVLIGWVLKNEDDEHK